MFSFFLRQLGKSVVAGRDLKKGEKLSLDNILVKCAEPHGIRPYLLDQLLGKSISCLSICTFVHLHLYARDAVKNASGGNTRKPETRCGKWLRKSVHVYQFTRYMKYM